MLLKSIFYFLVFEVPPIVIYLHVSLSELLPDAAHCFYSLATSLFWLEKLDLKHKYCYRLFLVEEL